MSDDIRFLTHTFKGIGQLGWIGQQSGEEENMFRNRNNEKWE